MADVEPENQPPSDQPSSPDPDKSMPQAITMRQLYRALFPDLQDPATRARVLESTGWTEEELQAIEEQTRKRNRHNPEEPPPLRRPGRL